MKRTLILLSIVFAALQLFANSWTAEEINSANTAANVPVLTQEEKEIIKYINLARMYPRKFADVEMENYFGGEKYGNMYANSMYRQSLINELRARNAVKPLYFNQEMYEYARCFAIESGRSGKTGHTRTTCPKGNFAECCCYGSFSGREFVIELLIDDGVSSLGHRRNCLSSKYTKCGPSIYTHTHYKLCCVIDFTDEPVSYSEKQYAAQKNDQPSSTQQIAQTPNSGNNSSQQSAANTTKPSSQTSNNSSQGIFQQATPTPLTDEYQGPSQQQADQTSSNSKRQQSTNYQSNPVSTPTTRPTSTGRKVSDNWQPSSSNSSTSSNSSKSSSDENVRDQFYETSGKTYLSFIKIGYTVAPHINVHLVDFGVLDFRARMFGLTLLNCEIKAYPFDEHFFYKPSIRLDIPISKFATLDIYGGSFTDIGETWKHFYHKDADANLFVSGFGGMGLGVKNFLRLFVEYRFPIYGENPDRDLLTIYLGLQISFGMKITK